MRGVRCGIETNILPLAASLRQVADRADGVLDRAGGLVDSAGGLLATNGAVIGQMVGSLNQTAQTLNRTALTQQGALGELVQSLRTAAEGLERLVGELSAIRAPPAFREPPTVAETK